jgi:hypothetical protein
MCFATGPGCNPASGHLSQTKTNATTLQVQQESENAQSCVISVDRPTAGVTIMQLTRWDEATACRHN